jgi:Alg9-like mannosyltransferase family
VRMILAFINDALLAAAAGVVAFVMLFGGGVFSVGTVRVSLRSPDNPLVGFSLLWALRFSIRAWAPWFGVRRWPTAALWNRCRNVLSAVGGWSESLTASQGKRIVLTLAVASVCLRSWYASTSPGFFSGDDVEIHEMTLGRLLGHSWTVWDLRSPIFPFGFVYPAQWLAYGLGVRDMTALVLAGRLSVVLLSTIAIYLVWRVGCRLWPHHLGYAVLGTALFASAKLSVAFGSSELPRPVSTVFVLLACLLLFDRRTLSVILSGAALAIAVSFRFSEVVFLLPAALQLAVRRPGVHLALFCVVTGLTGVLLLAMTDWYYWGQPFHSVRAAIDFTLMRGSSTRGYQPWWWYLLSPGQWTTVPVFCLAVAGTIEHWRLALWAAVPLGLLSLLPHKEARYAIPLIPFVSLLAVAGIQRAAARARDVATDAAWLGPAVVSGLLIGGVHDVAHYRLPRSNAEVQFAKYLAREIRPPALLVERLWRLGGRLYLPNVPVGDLDPDSFQDPNYLSARLTPRTWVVIDEQSAHARVARAILVQHDYRLVARDRSGYVLWRPADD